SGQVTLSERLDSLLIVLRQTTRVRLVVPVIAKTHCDLSDSIAMLFKESSDGTMFLDRIALAQIWKSQPMPILISPKLLQTWFVGKQVLLESILRICIEIDVRESVIAHGKSGIAPELQNLRSGRVLLHPLRIHKAVRRRRMRSLQRTNNAVGDVQAREARCQRPVSRQIVERERNLGHCVRGRITVWRRR